MYRKRLVTLVLIDSLMIIFTSVSSYLLVFATLPSISPVLIITLLSLFICYYIFSVRYKLYKKAWEYVSIDDLVSIMKLVIYANSFAAFMQLLLFEMIQFRFIICMTILQVFFIGGSRFFIRIVQNSKIKRDIAKERTLIIGAGSAGTMVARQLQGNQETELQVVAFLDDDPKKQNLDIYGVPVLGGMKQIEETVRAYDIAHIIIAIPSLHHKQLKEIYYRCAQTKAKTKILPLLEDVITGKVSVTNFRDVNVEDLLGREQVQLDMESISDYITNKVVLVTGAGGSIGSEICRQVSQFLPKKLILLGHGENSIYSIEMELLESYRDTSIIFHTEIADIQDKESMFHIMEKYKPHVVYHAAAHKHVPLMERNPEQAIKNNLLGTKNIANAAHWHQVHTFVMLSTDKAVNPTSVMGATKRLAEMIIQDLDRQSETKFIAVRFGNVLGSRGSVIPLFKKQLNMGGPLTVTHPDMERYFMTIKEASRLVLQAGGLASGGEIFVLDMGEPVKIVDLAKNIITLSGYSVDEIGISFSGKRPGEKLFEELLNENEVNEDQIFTKIYLGKSSQLFIEDIDELLLDFMILDKQVLIDRVVQLANKKVEFIHEKQVINNKALPIPG
ncbi:polysaccharide biosynthesis protein [Alkalihalobacillus pseudalcaliphilus]|uniref:polysaccharide biosynthesis protein n=1 Tax=Alkalihalobacillus pseudalcaliphilus TaxID=79884 RepID=UPI00064D76FF|nr:nucleoside-diphosphate sugar epimerase/dehydratase [Alkalihalobacillus pseudalcaliphilus]KMK75040.1 polysaccharide biosynthesis protein EpsC [Alkalihalobacillus pseudalcaliphilus]